MQRRLCWTHSARSCAMSTTGLVRAASRSMISSSSLPASVAAVAGSICASASAFNRFASATLPRSMGVNRRSNFLAVFVIASVPTPPPPGFNAGFHSKNVFAPRGAPSSVMTSMASSPSPLVPLQSPTSPARPIKSRACSRGLATVALLMMNFGAEPYSSRHILRSRRRIIATFDPNTPPYACASSTTTKRNPDKNCIHALCDGRTLTCNMSGFVTTHRARSRISFLSTSGVSPSKTSTSNAVSSSRAPARMPRNARS
mmetsp:Transcript_8880/g.29249  ORF Transcript_8880/g.29249 Transcript_8880/m.29249 type:complete len:258 (-) Transcript_8880:1649-2422(-)